jgi:hypothetical protein
MGTTCKKFRGTQRFVERFHFTFTTGSIVQPRFAISGYRFTKAVSFRPPESRTGKLASARKNNP